MHSGWCGPEVFSEIIYRPPRRRWKLHRATKLQRNSYYIMIENIKDNTNVETNR